MNAVLWNKVGALYNAYDGSLSWMEFLANYRKSDTFERDVWLLAACIHHPKDLSDPWEWVTVWSPFMEKTPLIDEIWEFACAYGDEVDRHQWSAGVWEITQVQQWKGGGEYWMVNMHHKDSNDVTNHGASFLERVNGKISMWRSEGTK